MHPFIGFYVEEVDTCRCIEFQLLQGIGIGGYLFYFFTYHIGDGDECWLAGNCGDGDSESAICWVGENTDGRADAGISKACSTAFYSNNMRGSGCAADPLLRGGTAVRRHGGDHPGAGVIARHQGRDRRSDERAGRQGHRVQPERTRAFRSTGIRRFPQREDKRL